MGILIIRVSGIDMERGWNYNYWFTGLHGEMSTFGSSMLHKCERDMLLKNPVYLIV